MQTTDAQVRRVMEEIEKHGGIGLAAMRAGMDRKTARKYVRAGKLPSELRQPHTWRTRADPFAEDWPRVVTMLEEAPELEARTLFEHLIGLKPEAYAAGQLRTLQRRIREWRAQRGPEREMFFPQAHRPGEAMQTDFTHATVLGVTICRRALRASALPQRPAVLELGVGDGVPLGVDGGTAARGAIDAVPARPRPGVPSDRQLDGGDPRPADGHPRLQRGVPGDDASLRPEAADDRHRGEGTERGRRGEPRRAQAPTRAAPVAPGEPRLRERRRLRAVALGASSRPPTGGGNRRLPRNSP